MKEQTNLILIRCVWSSNVSNLLSWRLKVESTTKGVLYSLVRLRLGLKGRLAYLGPNHRCTCLTGYTDLG